MPDPQPSAQPRPQPEAQPRPGPSAQPRPQPEAQPRPQQVQRFRFGTFEADPATGELRRGGVRVRLHAQPFQVLCMLLARPGELLTRDEISRALWPEGTFVDDEQGLNSAMNRLREALGDKAQNPRFVETLARRGYRFVAPVERIGDVPSERIMQHPPEPSMAEAANVSERPESRFLASAAELPEVSQRVVRTLFLLLQLMYLAFYVGALANLPEIADLLSVLPAPGALLALTIASAALLIPVRIFVITAVLLHPPNARAKLLRLWPLLLVSDVLWALSPFLLLHHMDAGLALACAAPLVYSPFAQRSLVLMGAGERG